MAKIKIEVRSENQGDGKGIIACEIWSHLSALSGVHHALIDENTDEYVVEIDFDVIAYFRKGEFQ